MSQVPEGSDKGGLLNTGISRRNVIKAGAIVGGTAWVAPVIDSFVSRAAAASLPPGGSGNFGLCSYTDLVVSLGGGAACVLKWNDPDPGCNLENTDGQFGGEIFPACNGVIYGVDSNNVISIATDEGPANGGVCPSGQTLIGTECYSFTEIPACSSGCSDFRSSSGGTVTWTSNVTILFALVHDGCFKTGTVSNGNTYCAPTGANSIQTCCS